MAKNRSGTGSKNAWSPEEVKNIVAMAREAGDDLGDVARLFTEWKIARTPNAVYQACLNARLYLDGSAEGRVVAFARELRRWGARHGNKNKWSSKLYAETPPPADGAPKTAAAEMALLPVLIGEARKTNRLLTVLLAEWRRLEREGEGEIVTGRTAIHPDHEPRAEGGNGVV